MDRKEALTAMQAINKHMGDGSKMNLAYRAMEVVRLAFAGIKNADEDGEWFIFARNEAKSLEPYPKYNPALPMFVRGGKDFQTKVKPFTFVRFPSVAREFQILENYFREQAEGFEGDASKILALCANYCAVLADTGIASAENAYKAFSAAYRLYASTGRERGPRGEIGQIGFEIRILQIVNNLKVLGASGLVKNSGDLIQKVMEDAGVTEQDLETFKKNAEGRQREKKEKEKK